MTWFTESMASVVPFTALGPRDLERQLFAGARHEAEHPRPARSRSRAAPARSLRRTTFHCGLTTKLQTSLRAASAGIETSSVSARARPECHCVCAFAGAETDERRFVVAHFHAVR